ncbi:MAG: NACHT domain-containing protein, partial [Bacteroidota bacterium]
MFNPDYQVIFILGDPGMGKSTLIERIATILSRSESSNMAELGKEMVPFPIILRNIKYDSITNWESLIDAYFQEPHLKDLDYHKNKTLVLELFERGQAFVLMDGLDEISSPQLRRNLSHVVKDGLNQYKKGYWWFTTRIVGFNQEKFFLTPEGEKNNPDNIFITDIFREQSGDQKSEELEVPL